MSKDRDKILGSCTTRGPLTISRLPNCILGQWRLTGLKDQGMLRDKSSQSHQSNEPGRELR